MQVVDGIRSPLVTLISIHNLRFEQHFLGVDVSWWVVRQSVRCNAFFITLWLPS
jgi:hypothetical protein